MQIRFSCHMICKLELLINESISFHFLFVRWFQSTVTCRWEYFVSLATTQGDWHMTLNTSFTIGNKKMHLSLADSLQANASSSTPTLFHTFWQCVAGVQIQPQQWQWVGSFSRGQLIATTAWNNCFVQEILPRIEIHSVFCPYLKSTATTCNNCHLSGENLDYNLSIETTIIHKRFCPQLKSKAPN